MSVKPLNPTQHPELELIQQLWMSGLRAKQIIAHLEANGLPPIKEEALARYGQRNWNHLYKMEIGEELKINTITNMMDALADEGLTVTKVSIQKNESLGWERDEEGVNHQVLKPSVKQTLEVRPNPTLQLEKATLAPIKITPLKGVNRLPQKADNLKTAVSIPDIQVGYFRTKTGELISLHDEAAVNVTLKMLQYLEASEHIDLIVLQGDNLDFPEFSSHRSAPGFIGNLQYAIDRYATILYAIRQICPTAEIVHLNGNHESRLVNTAVDKMPGLVGLSRAGETKPLLGIEYLCRFDDVNVTHIEDYPNGVHWANEGLRFIHGSAVSAAKGATSAKHLSLGVSTVAGHAHRAELVWDRRMTKDGALQIFAGSAGTLAKINGEIPSSKTGVNPSGGLPYRKGTETWQQGIMVIHYEHEGFNAYPHIVPINEGGAYLHGKRFQSSVDSNGCDL